MKLFGQPEVVATDRLRSYGAAMKVIGSVHRKETGRWKNNRSENSDLPFRRREHAMCCLRRKRILPEICFRLRVNFQSIQPEVQPFAAMPIQA